MADNNISKQERDFQKVLRTSVNNNDVKTVRRLVKGGVDVNKRYWYDGTLLHDAVSNGSTDIVELLIKAKADVNSKNKDDRSPLHLAARSGQEKIFDLLLKAGADIDVLTSDKRTCLHIALWKGHVEICQKLVKSGCDVNIKDSDGCAPLFWAVRQGERSLIFTQLLVENGADVNVQNKAGDTPLFGSGDRMDVTRYLVENGASVNVLNKARISPVVQALGPVSQNVVKYLVKEGGVIPAETWERVEDVHNQITKWDLMKGFRLLTKPDPKLLKILFETANFQDYDLFCKRTELHYRLSKEILNEIRPGERNVATLQSYCRQVVRKMLSTARQGRSLSPAVNSLVIPQTLKDFLMLSELTYSAADQQVM